MGYDPREPRDKSGKWTGGGSSYGRGRQELKGKYAGPNKNVGTTQERRKQLDIAKNREGKTWSQMNSTQKKLLLSQAQFATKTKPGKVGKLPTLGKTAPRMMPEPFQPSEPNVKAVAIETAKNLDKDFRAARDKANIDAMHAALAKTSAPITKLPPGKGLRKR